MSRVYLDWNATAPLRPEARAAMLAAMDAVGNPSSVHAEGRAAKAIVEKARGQVAALVGCEPSEVVFTSGATEAAALALVGRETVVAGKTDHDCVWVHAEHSTFLSCDTKGVIQVGPEFDFEVLCFLFENDAVALSAANSETGVLSPVRDNSEYLRERIPNSCVIFSDEVQRVGKLPANIAHTRADLAAVSSHKISGPKGTGALFVRNGLAFSSFAKGGGQEQGRRSGTENVIGIAGFGAAAEAAQRDLEAGVWDGVAALRNRLEDALVAAAPDLHIFGKEAPRLPNTSCFAVPGWRGETQVMQMDLAGFAVSAGSACSSGKVNKASRVLLAMGFDDVTASSAIRVSMGPTTTEAEVMAFADTWIDHYRRRKGRAA